MIQQCAYEGMQEIKATPTFSIFILREYIHREILDSNEELTGHRMFNEVVVTVYTVNDGEREKIHEARYDGRWESDLYNLMKYTFTTQVTGIEKI